MYKWIESKDDIICLSEDMFFWFEELMDTILKERNLHNSKKCAIISTLFIKGGNYGKIK